MAMMVSSGNDNIVALGFVSLTPTYVIAHMSPIAFTQLDLP
jgi:hypothetical protein